MVNRTLFMFITTVLKLLTNVVLLLILARNLGPDTFGLFIYPYTLSSLIILIVDYGFNLQVVRNIAIDNNRFHDIITQTLFAKILLTVFVLINTFIFTIILIGFDYFDWTVFYILLGSATLNSFALLFNLSFRGLNLFHKEAKVTVLSSILTFVIICSMVFLEYDLIGISLGFVISKGLYLFISWYEYQSLVINEKYILPSWIKIIGIIRTGFPFAAHALIGTLYFQVDTIIIKHYLDMESVGLYQAGMRFTIGGLFLAEVLSNVNLTRMATTRDNDGEILRIAKSMTRHCIAIGTIGYIIMNAGAYWITNFVYGSSYILTSNLLPLFGLILLLRYWCVSYGILLTIADRQVVRLFIVASAFIINVILNIYLISKFYLIGSVIAGVIVHIYLIIIYIIFSWNQIKNVLLELRSLVMIVTSIIMGSISSIVTPEDIMFRIGIILITCFIVVFVGITFKEWKTLYYIIRNRLVLIIN
jgi:O-antigen/teichoic acid export membrane protein